MAGGTCAAVVALSLRLGSRHLAAGAMGEARDVYRKALLLAPDDIKVLRALASLLAPQEDARERAVVLERLLGNESGRGGRAHRHRAGPAVGGDGRRGAPATRAGDRGGPGRRQPRGLRPAVRVLSEPARLGPAGLRPGGGVGSAGEPDRAGGAAAPGGGDLPQQPGPLARRRRAAAAGPALRPRGRGPADRSGAVPGRGGGGGPGRRGAVAGPRRAARDAARSGRCCCRPGPTCTRRPASSRRPSRTGRPPSGPVGEVLRPALRAAMERWRAHTAQRGDAAAERRAMRHLHRLSHP